MSPRAAKLGVQEVEKAISSLVEAGLSPEDAFDTYSAMSVHVRGSVVLQRLREKNLTGEEAHGDIDDTMTIDPRPPRCWRLSRRRAITSARPTIANFEFGLECILDHAGRLIEQHKKPARKAAAKSTAPRGARSRHASQRNCIPRGLRGRVRTWNAIPARTRPR